MNSLLLFARLLEIFCEGSKQVNLESGGVHKKEGVKEAFEYGRFHPTEY